MSERVILVTGATDGIGKETAMELASTGHTVLVHGRNANRCEVAVKEIAAATGNHRVHPVIADFSSFREIRDMAGEIREKWEGLNVLVNNAGVYMRKVEISRDGFEMTLAVNHLAPFLLTGLLLETLVKNGPARIVNVSSMTHSGISKLEFDSMKSGESFDGYTAYSMTKLCNVLFTYELSDRLKEKNVTVNCLHPGVIGTKLLRVGWGGGSGASVQEGASTSVYLAGEPGLEGVTGKYFVNRKEQSSSRISYNKHIQQELWRHSEKWTDFRYSI